MYYTACTCYPAGKHYLMARLTKSPCSPLECIGNSMEYKHLLEIFASSQPLPEVKLQGPKFAEFCATSNKFVSRATLIQVPDCSGKAAEWSKHTGRVEL